MSIILINRNDLVIILNKNIFSILKIKINSNYFISYYASFGDKLYIFINIDTYIKLYYRIYGHYQKTSNYIISPP